jgi:lysophospholipid acyltransferase (LPLAT)-like uncharacterized protein
LKPASPSSIQRFAAHWLCNALRLCAATHRFRIVDPHRTFPAIHGQQVIFAVWHNRLAFSVIVYRWLFQNDDRPRRLAALVSASRDGALLSAALEDFGVQPVRGSSSRRGPQALLELTSWAERGFDLAITPDGPRGPLYRVQPGAIAIARYTGLPLIPVSMNVRGKVELRSWDRFQLPLPLGVTSIEFGPLLRVGPGDDAQLEPLQAELQRRLEAITRDA